MQFVEARHGGFCYGVRRAMSMVERCLSENDGGVVQTLGPLIHNPAVVADLAARGVRVADAADLVPGTVVIRSHGVSPDVFAQLASQPVQVVDATCPHVARVQQLVRSHSDAGDTVVIVGHPQHPEVIGQRAWGQSVWVAANVAAVRAMPDSAFEKKLFILAQTTITQELFEAVVDELSQRATMAGVQWEVCATRCDATIQRQREAVEIARNVDAMLIVGGFNSSNTCKLYELCAAVCPQTLHIETILDVPEGWIQQHKGKIIGISAGASTPDGMMKEVITSMNDLKNIQGNEQENTEVDVPAQESASGQETVTSAETIAETVAETAVEVTADTAVAETAQETADDLPAAAQEPVTAEAETASSTEETETQEPVGETMDSMEDYEKTMVSIRGGQVVKGTIVQVTDKELSVNIGYKSDGIIPRSELLLEDDASMKTLFAVGEEIEAQVIKLNDGEGNVLLSKKALDSRKNWSVVEQAFEDKIVMEGKGTEVVKGGLIANIQGIRAFIPASQVSTRYVEDLSSFVGKTMRLEIIELDRGKRRVVASQKNVLIAEEKQKKTEVWSKIIVGERRTGIVRRLTDFGAFVDLGGVDGLIHISDLSWGHVRHPSQVVKVNDEIEVEILSADQEKNRISLGYKQTQPQPWDNVEAKYPLGAIFEGNVVRIAPFGAFIELEPGVDGLVHISQISHTRVNKVEDVLQVGAVVHVKVLEANSENHRISLSIRDAYGDEEYYEDETAATEEKAVEETPLEDTPAAEVVEEPETAVEGADE